MKKYGRSALIVGAVAMVFLAAYLIISALWIPKDPKPAPDLTGVTADGKTLYSLSDNRGKSGTVLLFFDTETPKALELMQQLSAAVPKYETVDVVAVSVGKGSIEEQLSALKEQEITLFPHILFDTDGEMAKTYNIGNTPITYFIDKNGLIQDAYVASISEKSLEKALKSIA